MLLLAGCRGKGDHLRYDDEGVATNVLGLVARNTRWARTQQADAVLYRIELRTDAASDNAPTDALYSFYSPASRTFMTATSDPRIPWDGAEAQDWPADRPEPLPLPVVPMDFTEAWQKAQDVGVRRVTSAVLEVNTRNTMPIVAWSILGQVPDIRESGVYLDALSGDRLYPHTLLEPPTSPLPVENAISRYRGALRGEATSSNGCAGKAVAIPAADPVTCFDAVTRAFSVREP